MQSGNFFVEVLRKRVHSLVVLAVIAFLPKFQLRENLIGEARAHDEAWVAGGATKVHQAAFGKNEDASLGFVEIPLVELSLDISAFGLATLLQFFQTSHVDFVVEVADIANDRFILHRCHVFRSDDVFVTGRSYENIRSGDVIFDRLDFIAFHGGLQRADRIDFGHDHAATLATESLAASLANVTITADDSDFSSEHHIGGAIQPVDQRVAASIQVVELALGDRVIDIDRREEQLSLGGHIIETLNAGGGFLRNTANGFAHRSVLSWILYEFLSEEIEDNAELFRLCFGIEIRNDACGFVLGAQVDEECSVTTIVDDHVWAGSVWPYECFLRAPPVFRQCFTLPRVNRSSDRIVEGTATANDDGRCCGVLGRENVAANPSHIRTEVGQCFDKNGGLHGHVEGTHDLCAGEGLGLAVASTEGHQARHFVFGKLDFLAAQACDFFRFFAIASGEKVKCANFELGSGWVHRPSRFFLVSNRTHQVSYSKIVKQLKRIHEIPQRLFDPSDRDAVVTKICVPLASGSGGRTIQRSMVQPDSVSHDAICSLEKPIQL